MKANEEVLSPCIGRTGNVETQAFTVRVAQTPRKVKTPVKAGL